MKGQRQPLLRLLVLVSAGVPPAMAAAPSWSVRPQVKVLHLGDSHVGARAFSSSIRAALVERFGDGDGGIVLADLSGADSGPGRITLEKGWKVTPARTAPSGEGSLAGGWAEASAAGATARIEGRFSLARVLLLRQPGGGRVALRLDGAPVTEILLSSLGPLLESARVPCASTGEHRIDLVATGEGPVRLLGAVLSSDRPGVVYSPIGVNGALASSLLKIPELLLARQLAEADPDLVILSYGTNETRTFGLEERVLAEQMGAIVGRVRKAVPRAAILVSGPPDQARRTSSGALAQVRKREIVSRAFREAARSQGTEFLDLAEAMGGAGAMAAWSAERPPLVQEDLVHFTSAGYLRLARLFAEGLEGKETARNAMSKPDSEGDVRLLRDARGRLHLTNTQPVPATTPLLGRTRPR